MPTLAPQASPVDPAQPRRWKVPLWMEPYEPFLPVLPPCSGRWIEEVEDLVNRNDPDDDLDMLMARVRLRARIRLLCELRKAGLLATNPRPGWYPNSGFEADPAGS